MERIRYNGVPMWKDSHGQLFMFEHNKSVGIHLGSEEHGLFPDWKQRVNDYRTAFRGAVIKRLRKPEPAAVKNETGGAGMTGQ